MLDADGDGAISKPEFDTFSNFAFDQMDTNDNGMISASEYGQALPADGFGDLDLDNSGDLSQDEFNMQMSKDFAAADRDGNGLLD
ncbi:hypothetical protein ATO3_01945 [Marinibacterium profundimaris]|uniref:EF-hand domain-containing protein n=2 Tax=Marinibacterium profundimaris TaxID=1679460 RepID=A0A225NV51_9RHOB|nr:hypothetical protein ATO3_01945 [Marinibacterium profundimaris]